MDSLVLHKKQGVYAFINNVNGKLYVGSAFNLRKRLLEHVNGVKSNIPLQRAFRKYGLYNFTFVIYEFYTSTNYKLTDLETAYILKMDKSLLYNLKMSATSMAGYTHTLQARLKMRFRLSTKIKHEVKSLILLARVKPPPPPYPDPMY